MLCPSVMVNLRHAALVVLVRFRADSSSDFSPATSNCQHFSNFSSASARRYASPPCTFRSFAPPVESAFHAPTSWSQSSSILGALPRLAILATRKNSSKYTSGFASKLSSPSGNFLVACTVTPEFCCLIPPCIIKRIISLFCCKSATISGDCAGGWAGVGATGGAPIPPAPTARPGQAPPPGLPPPAPCPGPPRSPP